MGLKARVSTCCLISAALIAAAATTSYAGDALPRSAIRLAMIDEEAFGRLSDFSSPAVRANAELSLVSRTLEAYREGDLAEGDRLAARITDPAAAALAEWFAIRSGHPVGFDRMATFQKANPDWPISTLLRRRAEEALLASRKPAAAIRAFFAQQAPLSVAGKLALADALKSEGRHQEAGEIIRKAWREDSLSKVTETRILSEFSGTLTTADHRFRMEQLLFRKSWSSALRAAAYAGKDYVLLAQARIAVNQGGRKAEAALAAVPHHFRSDSSYIFSKALLLRRKENFAEAARAMAEAPRDPSILVDGDEWWEERRLVARKLLDKGDAQAAYLVASHHGAEGDAPRIEAEFHAGWIALRFLNEPETAAKHFAHAAEIAETPISVARAAYWQGRAAEAAGEPDVARQHYARAADKPITYYGQLARAKLGYTSLELRRPDVTADAVRDEVNKLRPVQALRLLNEMGERDLAVSLYSELAQHLTDVAQLDALGALAAEQNNARAVLAVGKTAVQRGFPLDLHAYPTIGIPTFERVGDEVEQAMVYAIARQESAFNPRALSTAGARGLMQLMPATAKRTAKRFGLGFDVKRLIEDPAYNAKLGSAHVSELMEDWRGSYILAFASYNAGGGNVKKWIDAYGDPRSPRVDPVDWIERIPFYETRNYVQRVLENLYVYRHRLQERSARALPLDLQRDNEARY